MKKVVWSLLLASLVVSCSKEGQFVAQIDGVEDQTEVYLSKLGPTKQPIPVDTTVVVNGSFKFDLIDGEPQQLNIIQVQDIPGNLFFIKENELISATLYKDSLRASKINGGINNNLFMSYMDSIQTMGNEAKAITAGMRQALSNQDRDSYMKLREEQKNNQEKC